MTEVEYDGGGHCTRLIDLKDQLLCLEVPPAPVYKGARGEAGRPKGGAPGGGVLLLVGVGLLLARPPPGRPHPLLDPLYTGARGTPRDTS